MMYAAGNPFIVLGMLEKQCPQLRPLYQVMNTKIHPVRNLYIKSSTKKMKWILQQNIFNFQIIQKTSHIIRVWNGVVATTNFNLKVLIDFTSTLLSQNKKCSLEDGWRRKLHILARSNNMNKILNILQNV